MGVLIAFIPNGVFEGERRLAKNRLLLGKRTMPDYLSAKLTDMGQRYREKSRQVIQKADLYDTI